MKRVFRILTIAVFTVLAVAACDKDNGNGNDDGGGNNGGGNNGGGNSGGGGNTQTAGTLKLTNVTSYPFKIYVDGAYKNTISGGSSYSYTDDAGYYNLKWEQTSGYYTYPLIQESSAMIYANQTMTQNIPTVTTGEIKVVSNSENPYTLFINGANRGTISGNSSKTVEVDAWHSYNVRVLQQSGYVLYPSEYTWTVNVDANYIYTITYPTKAGENSAVEIK